MNRVGIICAIALLGCVFTACEKRAEYLAQFLPETFEDFEPGETLSPDSPQPKQEGHEPEQQVQEPELKPEQPETPEQVAKPEEYAAPDDGVRPPTSHENQGFFARMADLWADMTSRVDSPEPDEPASPDLVVRDPEPEPQPKEPQPKEPQPKEPQQKEPTEMFSPEPIQARKAKAKKANAKVRAKVKTRRKAKDRTSAKAKAIAKLKGDARQHRAKKPAAKQGSLRLSAYTPRRARQKNTLSKGKLAKVHTPAPSSSQPARLAYEEGLKAYERRNKDKAYELFLLACSGGYFKACNRYGFAQMSQGNVKGARNYFKVACHNGVARGCNNLGWAYEQVSKFPKAKLYYSQACAKRHQQGCSNYLRLRALLKTKPYLKSVLKR